jgi:predicted dehydrogenase
MSRKYRIGIIGCGGIANGKHLPSLSKLSNVELVAFCDIVQESAATAAQNMGLKARSFAKIIEKYCKMPRLISCMY